MWTSRVFPVDKPVHSLFTTIFPFSLLKKFFSFSPFPQFFNKLILFSPTAATCLFNKSTCIIVVIILMLFYLRNL